MLAYFVLSIMVFFLGLSLILIPIIFRKHIEPSVMMALIFMGGLVSLVSVFFFLFFGFILQN
jgi:hypothetical protein